LDVSRISRGKIELRTGRVELGTLVERAVELIRPLLDERGHRFTVDLPGEPVTLWGDAARLVQIVANLLQNAAKYTDRGGNISLHAIQEGEALRLAVRDDGVGLTEQMRERVFEPFVQAPRSRDRARGGLGVGLALVRGLVALHGGSVLALSDGPGRGSEFVVRLPLRSAAAEASAADIPGVEAPA
ncbi:MAG: ATP-binding protein, partial [Acidobacteriota bacterium]|nr:ATP-binding protein [Acidobacteriota bacterium]